MSLDKTKLITADILGQATAMGVHLNDEDVATRDRLMKEVEESTREEPSLEQPMEVEDIPQTTADRVIASANDEANDKFLEPDVPEEVQAELDAPDFDQMVEQELDSRPYEGTRFEDTSYHMVQGDDDWEDLDEAVIEERKKRIAAEKKAAYYENLRFKSEQGNWAKEAREYYPLAGSAIDAGHITARSRKDFLKQARSAHQAVLPYIKEVIEIRDQSLEAEKTKARNASRQAAIKAWGRPTTGPSSYPGKANDFQEELAATRKKGDLERTIGILRRKGLDVGMGARQSWPDDEQPE